MGFSSGSGFTFLQISFWVRTCLKSPKLRGSIEKKTVHLYRSTVKLMWKCGELKLYFSSSAGG